MERINNQRYVTSVEAAIMLDLSAHRVAEMCRMGIFPSAFKPGHGRQAEWRILRSEITAHKFNGHLRNKPNQEIAKHG